MCCGGACPDADVQDCVCAHMPSCCGAGWSEACASIGVAHNCIPDGGCPAFETWAEFNCTCSTTDVNCPDDPFVSQLIFPTDACGLTEAEALGFVEAACEEGNGDCEIGAGSCDCSCTDLGSTCGPTEE